MLGPTIRATWKFMALKATAFAIVGLSTILGTIVCLAEPCALLAVPIINATKQSVEIESVSVTCIRKIVKAIRA